MRCSSSRIKAQQHSHNLSWPFQFWRPHLSQFIPEHNKPPVEGLLSPAMGVQQSSFDATTKWPWPPHPPPTTCRKKREEPLLTTNARGAQPCISGLFMQVQNICVPTDRVCTHFYQNILNSSMTFPRCDHIVPKLGQTNYKTAFKIPFLKQNEWNSRSFDTN